MGCFVVNRRMANILGIIGVLILLVTLWSYNFDINYNNFTLFGKISYVTGGFLVALWMYLRLRN